MNGDKSEVMSKVLAWLGYASLGIAAMFNVLLGTLMLMGGSLIEAFGDPKHAALIVKLIAVGFFVLAASEYAAGHFLKRRIRTLFIPIACALTIVGEVAFSVWTKHWSAIDAIIAACALFSAWVWSRLPRDGAATL
jgi:hypothetical protein